MSSFETVSIVSLILNDLSCYFYFINLVVVHIYDHLGIISLLVELSFGRLQYSFSAHAQCRHGDSLRPPFSSISAN